MWRPHGLPPSLPFIIGDASCHGTPSAECAVTYHVKPASVPSTYRPLAKGGCCRLMSCCTTLPLQVMPENRLASCWASSSLQTCCHFFTCWCACCSSSSCSHHSGAEGGEWHARTIHDKRHVGGCDEQNDTLQAGWLRDREGLIMIV